MRKLKSGKRGLVTKYISRSKAIRKLQLSLKDFRKLCILKGVYPRQPPQKLKKFNKTYYHTKDINFLGADVLIQKFRSQKVFMKKYKKAKAKANIGQVKYLAKHKPKYSLTHLLRQRYPQFIDALRDLDDPLSMISLFSIFPTHKQFTLNHQRIQACIDLLRYFNKYVIETRSLKKVFLSIKGIYYQVEIMGQKITYLTPYQYPPNLPMDVDYRVMSTFLQFYEVLLKFVLYKLYNSINKQYPPMITNSSSSFFTYSCLEVKQIENLNTQENKYQIDEEFKNANQQVNQDLFKNLVFFLNSQVPRYSLEFIILACGGKVYWEGLDENVKIDSKIITHVITDRQDIKQKKTKEYIQPQWVYDSINQFKLLNVKQYAVGSKLPPHLSPFVDTQDFERHIPQREKQLRNIKDKIGQVDAEMDEEEQDDNEQAHDVLQEEKRKKNRKKKQQKQILKMSKDIMSSKNRKLLKAIEIGRRKDKTQNQRLKQKAKKIKNQ